MFPSSTCSIPGQQGIPRHVVILIDGEGAWTPNRFISTDAGYLQGVEGIRRLIEACIERRIGYLTLLALHPEIRHRPGECDSLPTEALIGTLEKTLGHLHQQGVRLRAIGDLSAIDARLVNLLQQGENLTSANATLNLTLVANYGGRWDLLQAFNGLVRACPEKAGTYTESDLEPFLALNFAPEPDLFIRTGGEQSISNFLLWQLAYCELYFTDQYWPDFDAAMLDAAIASFRQRERRFGRTSEQLQAGILDSSGNA